jgi:hypothetical protein
LPLCLPSLLEKCKIATTNSYIVILLGTNEATITVGSRSKAWTVFVNYRTLGWWLRIPLKASMSVCVYSVCVVLCVGSDLVTGWSFVQGVLPSV